MHLYPGPIRGEALAIELHNTLYAAGGDRIDGLADAPGLRAWLTAVADALPVDPAAVDAERRIQDFRSLRNAVREALHAVLERRPIDPGAVAELDRASARAPRSLRLSEPTRTAELRQHAPTATDALIGAIAASTIELVGGPHAADLRACGAPGCVLVFIRDHPRREWCSPACGNRARQARHYARTRARRDAPLS